MTCVFTLGHSTRSFEDVLDLLKGHGIGQLIDVRRFPGSKKYPQWDQAALVAGLPDEISYTWIAELGGRRYTPVGTATPNGFWRVKAFRDYADHMRSEEFAHGLRRLVDAAERAPTAIMCSEAVPWRCHRRLITDALLVAGVDVAHIISSTRTEPAVLNPHALVESGLLTYPPAEGQD